ncbi:hypothetical protein BC941DRAFT_445958 [Chlamydoabsidia padenii]|nr:hypothetical protein BC941DRAFT_445958 [Chlamydoabsidia padenii]
MVLHSPPGTPRSSNSYQGPLTPSHTKSYSHVHRTTGESLSCLVGASITTVGNTIYVLGGFDRYSDEVFNTLYALTLDEPYQQDYEPYRWRRLVYNTSATSSILAKRNDHTSTLWGTDKLVVFGGTGEEDDGKGGGGDRFYTQVAILDLHTLQWNHPSTTGCLPMSGRIKHSATIYQDKLYIAGGLDRHDHVADTVLVLNLLTYEWLPPLAFVPRSQHMTFVYNKRLYLFGGYHPDMSRSNVLSFLDLESTSVTQLEIDSPSAPPLAAGEQFAQICGDQLVVVVTTCSSSSSDLIHDKKMNNINSNNDMNNDNSTTNIDNTIRHENGDQQDNEPTINTMPRSTSSCSLSSGDTGLWTIDLTSMQWQHHDITTGQCHWQYFSMAEHANNLILFGATDDDLDEYYTMVLQIHLKEHGIVPVPPSQLGTDLAGLLLSASASNNNNNNNDNNINNNNNNNSNNNNDTNSSSSNNHVNNNNNSSSLSSYATTTADFTLLSSTGGGQVKVHRLVLLARWPHFAHLMNSGMVESLGDTMTLPEPLAVIQTFVRFLYTDTLQVNDDGDTSDLVADLMVMANLYLLPRLLALCVRRLYGCISTPSVAKIYQAAIHAGQDALAQVALAYMLRHFGQVVKTPGFRTLPSSTMARLLDQIPFFSSILLVPDYQDVPDSPMTLL